VITIITKIILIVIAIMIVMRIQNDKAAAYDAGGRADVLW
jgi:hypothetical protein